MSTVRPRDFSRNLEEEEGTEGVSRRSEVRGIGIRYHRGGLVGGLLAF